MSSTPHESGTEGVLLLYLADELSAGERGEVEQRLLREPALRAELERLREAEEMVRSRLASLDAATPLAAGEAAAVRNVSRVLRQRLARPPVAAPAERVREPRRWPRWVASVAVAAVVAAFMVGVGFKLNELRDSNEEFVASGDGEPEADPLALFAGDTFARYAAVAASEGPDPEPPPAAEIASVSYDQPLFDVPFNIPPEAGLPKQP